MSCRGPGHHVVELLVVDLAVAVDVGLVHQLLEKAGKHQGTCATNKYQNHSYPWDGGGGGCIALR